jgi:hypothetical protein
MAHEQTEFTEEWLLNAIDLVSFCIVEDGAVYAPVLERLEAELQIIRNREDVVARARRNIERRRNASFLSSPA